MENQNIEDIVRQIGEIEELDGEKKAQLIEEIKSGEKTETEALDLVDDALQAEIEDTFKGEDVTLDADSPEVQAEKQILVDSLKSAEETFGKEIDGVKNDSDQAYREISAEKDELEKAAAMEKLQ
ncbi:MAG: hypothetical protein WAV31_02180 [Candidatus Moraniibacteriota bacterium]